MLENRLPSTILRLENKSGRKKNRKSGTVGTYKNEVNFSMVREEYRMRMIF